MDDLVQLELEYVDLHTYTQGQTHAIAAVVRLLDAHNTGKLDRVHMEIRLAELYYSCVRAGDGQFELGERAVYQQLFTQIGCGRQIA